MKISRALEQQIEAESSRIKVLQEMKRAYEGYYSSVRNVLRDAARDPLLGKCIEGVVAELIRVPCEYESAIEMTLGLRLTEHSYPYRAGCKAGDRIPALKAVRKGDHAAGLQHAPEAAEQ